MTSACRHLLVGLLLPLLLLAASAAAAPRVQYRIVTASERGTYIEIGRDLAKWVANPAGIDLEVLPSKGSTENVHRLRDEPGVKLALVQSDVYQAFVDQARAGNAAAGRIIGPLRLVMPLYDEEIHFVVRADSPLRYIHEIRGRRLGVGAMGSGTALTAGTLYQAMFQEPIADANRHFLSPEDALYRLTGDRSIDVAVIVAGQPAKIFSEMKPGAGSFIRVLQLDPRAPETARALQTYFPVTLRAASYPAWLGADVPTLAVKAYLATYDYPQPGTAENLARFADALCTGFDRLQASGHPKWKQVKLELPPLGQGWRYYAPVERRLRSCIAARSAPKARACSEQEVVLGLCARR